MTGQLGDGAAIAARTGLPVVTDLRAMDVALGGQGAPIVPMGERLLWNDVELFLNIGGIANISVNTPGRYLAYDVCPANRVLNMLALEKGRDFDEGGKWAASGRVHDELLEELNELPYYGQAFPKSLANDFGTDVVYPLLKRSGFSVDDLLATYSAHIAEQVSKALEHHLDGLQSPTRMLVTGGGAMNDHLMKLLSARLEPFRIAVERPEDQLINFKEAMIMGLLGVLRWREEVTTLTTVTGASRDSVGGALWCSG
jgi:anhydro-N-acetylmuramic acid kinase